MSDVPSTGNVPDIEDTIAAAIADATGGVTKADTVQTKAIGDLAVRQLQLTARLKEYEQLSKTISEELKKISEYDLPNAMAEAGMKEFTLLDGSKISIQRVYAASVKVADRPMAFQWMRERGHESLIKTEVNVPLGKGAHEAAEKIMAELQAQFPEYTPQLEESVHWQTLRAFVKEQVEAEELAAQQGETVADPLPREMLGVYIIDQAKITPKKEKK